MELKKVFDQINSVFISSNPVITQLEHEEDNELYQVWKIDSDNGSYILKEAKGNEANIYALIPDVCKESIPLIYQTINVSTKTYLLMEYINGENLCKCNRKKLTLALDALIQIQSKTWNMNTTGF